MAELTHDDVQKILKIIDEMGDRDVHLEIAAATRCRSSSVAIAEVFTTRAYNVYKVDSCPAHDG